MPMTALPAAPSTSSPSDFAAKADALLTALPGFVTEANALETAVDADKTAAAASAIATAADAIATAADRVQTGLDRAAAAGSASAAAASASAAAGSASTSAGWSATSTTSMALTAGAKTLTIQTGKQFTPGTNIKVKRTSNPAASHAFAAVSTYDSGTGALAFTLATDEIVGSGTYTDWTVELSGAKGATGPAGTVPSGSILMWSGSIASIPAGYVLCDGTNGTPDLRDKFVVGAGSTYAVNATGGAASNTPTITVGSTTLSTAQMPSHMHGIGSTNSGAVNNARSTLSAGLAPNYDTSAEGGGGSHTHTGSSAAVPTLPPYLALAYIMKT